jgi:hypothetical protein
VDPRLKTVANGTDHDFRRGGISERLHRLGYWWSILAMVPIAMVICDSILFNS